MRPSSWSCCPPHRRRLAVAHDTSRDHWMSAADRSLRPRARLVHHKPEVSEMATPVPRVGPHLSKFTRNPGRSLDTAFTNVHDPGKDSLGRRGLIHGTRAKSSGQSPPESTATPARSRCSCGRRLAGCLNGTRGGDVCGTSRCPGERRAVCTNRVQTTDANVLSVDRRPAPVAASGQRHVQSHGATQLPDRPGPGLRHRALRGRGKRQEQHLGRLCRHDAVRRDVGADRRPTSSSRGTTTSRRT